MAKEKSNNHKRIGKKNPLKVLTCNAGILTVNFFRLIVQAERENLDKFTAFEKLDFYLMELNYKKKYEQALLDNSKILPRKKKKAQKKQAIAIHAEIPEICSKIAEAATLVKPENEDRMKVLKELVRLFSLYEDSDDIEAQKVLLLQKELFGFTDKELEVAKNRIATCGRKN